jgi:uncharacterized protein involved in exopolysaccharide biosynthesis
MIESLPSILSNAMIQQLKTDYVSLQRKYSGLHLLEGYPSG